MGNQKLKWTWDEEDALLAGKWKNILRDPGFSDQLINRSNINLKDKWRNSSVAPGTQCTKDKWRKFVVDTKNPSRYDGMIFEALSALADANGSDVGSIFSFIEPRHEVPPNFRRVLSSRLRRLAAQGKLSKVSNSKPIKQKQQQERTCPKNLERQMNQMIGEAAITTACSRGEVVVLA